MRRSFSFPFTAIADATSSTGRLFLAVLGGVADVEREMIMTNTAEVVRDRQSAWADHESLRPTNGRRVLTARKLVTHTAQSHSHSMSAIWPFRVAALGWIAPIRGFFLGFWARRAICEAVGRPSMRFINIPTGSSNGAGHGLHRVQGGNVTDLTDEIRERCNTSPFSNSEAEGELNISRNSRR